MNSTTGDFSEIRKSIPDEIYNRGAHTTLKIKPRKLINLRPLNINGIKKEIEEDDNQNRMKRQHNTVLNTRNEYISEADVKLHQEDVDVNDVDSEQKHIFHSDRLKDITNSESVNNFQDGDEHCIERPLDIKHPHSDRGPMSQVKENRLIPQKNDSFDLDFSALSISTPVKSIPSVNVKSEQLTGPFQQFVTPNINKSVKNQCSLSKRPFLRTPIVNNSSVRNLYTPYQSKLTCKLSPTIPEDHSIPNSGCKTFPNYPEDKVSTRGQNAVIQTVQNSAYKTEKTRCSIPMSTFNDDTFTRMKVNDIEYIVFGLIGKGGSSEVYQCYNLESRIHVAIKCVSLENSTSANSYINEVKLLKRLQNCDKIIKMYDYEISESQQKLLVVLENGGKDLSSILKQLAGQKSHIPVYMLLFYWMEMLYAVKQIHSNGIIHSDLKPANFLKVDEGLKLIDFGIASSVQTDMTSVVKTKQEGSCNYISPEALNGESPTNFSNINNEKYKIHYKSDVWSLGCILYQFVYRRTPFQHITQLWPKLAAIMNPDQKIDYPNVDWVSPKIINTIKKCLQYNVKLRPSVEELIAEYENILHSI